jgi:hypothetical protein
LEGGDNRRRRGASQAGRDVAREEVGAGRRARCFFSAMLKKHLLLQLLFLSAMKL